MLQKTPASAACAAVAPLLAPDEPPAVEIVNGEARAPILILCDHASRRVPRVLGDLGVEPTAFERHVAWDVGAAGVARRLAASFDAPLVMAGYSRLVIDLNRALDHPDSIPVLSEDVVVPGNRGLSPDDRLARVAALFEPYHEAVASALETMLERGDVPVVVSVHSFTPVYAKLARPWHCGVLWDRDPRLADPLIARLAAAGDVLIGDNEPYSGGDGTGYTVHSHAAAQGLPHVTLEIRQDLIAADAGVEAWAERLIAAFRPLLADPAIHQIAHY